MGIDRKAPEDAIGTVLAHSVKLPEEVLKKGSLLSKDLASRLLANKIEAVTVVSSFPDDCHEDLAAQQISERITLVKIRPKRGIGGRINLVAENDGLFCFDENQVHLLNRVSESITIATLPDKTAVKAGQLVATLKIIPFFVADTVLTQALTISAKITLELRSWSTSMRVSLIQTKLPSLPEKVYEKSVIVQTNRLANYGLSLNSSCTVDHKVGDLMSVISDLSSQCDLILILGASAICDRTDVLPEAISRSGGTIDHFGMPVDPGNLLLIGHLGETQIIGLPGCARSPALNGIDLILDRLFARLPIDSMCIQGMGVGGLLKDSPARGISRVEQVVDGSKKFGAIVLGGGLSSRMKANKLLARWKDDRQVIDPVLDLINTSDLDKKVFVGSRDFTEISQRLATDVIAIQNPHPEFGLASSLKLALAQLSDVDAVIILLGDMPLVQRDTVVALMEAFDPTAGAAMVYPVYKGKRGNPVLIGKRFFDELADLSGDQGARVLIDRYPHMIKEVPVNDRGTLIDIDDPLGLERALAFY